MNERAYERAFPLRFSYVERRTNATVTYTNEGMTLRDYFAAQCIVGQWTHDDNQNRKIAEGAYHVADAMLAAREKQNHTYE